ncbi:LAGLIDADG family homing endonuclease [Streptomyces sp. t39]|uniref:LAGLIDADG family homing endonuclease n=1 Tax=Streptomyces sp. t39 TaxID=1828156 RepID=UPI0011CE55A6|nr:LAGLIDADG family homing endonuclease [Streptomyces sp. t39]
MPLPPYLLGYWLGDGDSDGPRFTASEEDLPHLEAQCLLAGARVVSRQRTHGRTFRIRFDLGARATALHALREMGVLHNKHIPPHVFRSSETQRRETLQGLVDSDGYIETGTNRVEVCFTSKRLALDTVELIRTLGFYPRLSQGNATLNGRITGTRYRIVFTAYEGDHAARLPRKAERLGPKGTSVPYSRVRTITEIKKVEPALVTRIRVSATGGTYLAGDGLIPVCDYT